MIWNDSVIGRPDLMLRTIRLIASGRRLAKRFRRRRPMNPIARCGSHRPTSSPIGSANSGVRWQIIAIPPATSAIARQVMP